MVPIMAVVLPRGAEHGIDQVRRGGLAVGPGDAGEKEAFVGPSKEVAGGERERLAAVRHLNPAAGEIGRRGRFADHGQGAAGQRIGGELAAVGLTAGEGEEERLRGDAARIELDGGDRGLGEFRRKRLEQRYTREYFA